jgi:hypothetical protein
MADRLPASFPKTSLRRGLCAQRQPQRDDIAAAALRIAALQLQPERNQIVLANFPRV